VRRAKSETHDGKAAKKQLKIIMKKIKKKIKMIRRKRKT